MVEPGATTDDPPDVTFVAGLVGVVFVGGVLVEPTFVEEVPVFVEPGFMLVEPGLTFVNPTALAFVEVPLETFAEPPAVTLAEPEGAPIEVLPPLARPPDVPARPPDVAARPPDEAGPVEPPKTPADEPPADEPPTPGAVAEPEPDEIEGDPVDIFEPPAAPAPPAFANGL